MRRADLVTFDKRRSNIAFNPWRGRIDVSYTQGRIKIITSCRPARSEIPPRDRPRRSGRFKTKALLWRAFFRAV
jgi:hypothetical protein